MVNTRLHKYEQGVSLLVLLLFLAFTGTMFISLMQSRLMLSSQRSVSFYDSVVTNYDAESEIYGYYYKVAHSQLTYPFTDQLTLSDGTLLTANGTVNAAGNEETVILKATRPYTVVTFKLNRIKTVVPAANSNDTEIILSIDCTTSMDECDSAPMTANQLCTRFGPDGKRLTKIARAKQAALAFIQAIKDMNNPHVKLGVSVSRTNSRWLSDDYSNSSDPSTFVSPTEDIDRIMAAVEDGFGSTHSSSPACKNYSLAPLFGATSIGTGYAFMHDYFALQPADIDKIEVLVTDGAPNSRTPISGCSSVSAGYQYCPYGGECPAPAPYSWNCPPGFNRSRCIDEGVNLLDCALSDTANSGIRDPEIITYSVTVFETPDPDVVEIMEENSTQYYGLQYAANLPQVLEDIAEQISETVTYNTTINRETP